MKTNNHLFFLDNLRVTLIVLVIAHHVGQAYGPTGGYWPIMEAARSPVLGPFFTVNRSFFMSLFFMIAGYFTVMSVDKYGPKVFIKERSMRLGLPALTWMLVMIPLQLFVFSAPVWPLEAAHLWFLEHLLIFSVVYALWWRFSKPDNEPKPQADPPGYGRIIVFAFLLAILSALVRIWFPIDRWVYLLGFIKVAFADVPRDLSFFVIGLIAYRQNWILRFPKKDGFVWLAVGVTLAVAWYVYALVGRNLLQLSDIQLGIIYPIWESLLCCGMCIGLTVLFREYFNSKSNLGSILAKSQYAAYVFHVPVVLMFQYLALGFDWSPFIKFTLVTILSVPTTFLFSNWIRKPLGL
jgi:multidrug transporter EmrE-like cation transporter